MDNKIVSFYYTAKPISFEKVNENFTKMRCYVFALGKNRNLSHIGMDAATKSLPSLANIPIVAHLKRKDDGGYYVGGHDRELVITNDEILLNDLTVPFGLVPETYNAEFIEIKESDGSLKTYLVCDIYLWTGRYGEIMNAVYSEDLYFNQSMEIDVKDYEPLKEDTNYADIKSFEFSALCLLGKSDDPTYHTEPCFPSAHVEPIKYSLENEQLKSEFSLMMSQLKELAFSINKESCKEGGMSMQEKLELLQKYGLTVESIDFEIEDLTIEQLQEKIDEFVSNGENGEGDTGETGNDETKLFSATYREKRDAISKALTPIYVRNTEGDIVEETSYWLQDFDDTFAFVEKDHYTLNTYDYVNGRFAYSFDDSNMTVTITGEFEEVVLVRMTKEEKAKLDADKSQLEKSFADLQEEFESYKKTYKTEESEVEELKKFKENRLAGERKDALDNIFSNFDEKLKDNEEYEALKAGVGDMSIDEVSEKCYAILGKKEFKIKFNFNNENKPVKIPIKPPTKGEDPYNGLFEKYGIYPKEQN